MSLTWRFESSHPHSISLEIRVEERIRCEDDPQRARWKHGQACGRGFQRGAAGSLRHAAEAADPRGAHPRLPARQGAGRHGAAAAGRRGHPHRHRRRGHGRLVRRRRPSSWASTRWIVPRSTSARSCPNWASRSAFTATVTVMPEVVLGEYKGLEVPKEPAEVERRRGRRPDGAAANEFAELRPVERPGRADGRLRHGRLPAPRSTASRSRILRPTDFVFEVGGGPHVPRDRRADSWA